MKVTEELYMVIVLEIAKLSLLIYEGLPPAQARGVAMLINHLTAILAGNMDISDFHDEISELPEQIREYYYKLLYLIK